jgi:hypothetical protein
MARAATAAHAQPVAVEKFRFPHFSKFGNTRDRRVLHGAHDHGVLGAEVLERLTGGRGRRGIRRLFDFLPGSATVCRTEWPARGPAARGRRRDAVLVAPGWRIPVDGTVRTGHPSPDPATIRDRERVIRFNFLGTVTIDGVGRIGRVHS